MFKIFKKNFNEKSNYSYEITDNDICINSDGSMIKIFGNGEYWENIDRSKYVIVPTIALQKSNIAFTICEPADFDYIDVYQVGLNYVAHDYNEDHDLVGVYYVIKDIKKFKEDKSKAYTFITYKNYTEEL